MKLFVGSVLLNDSIKSGAYSSTIAIAECVNIAVLSLKHWACNTCDGVICVHRGYCLACGEK